MWNHPLAIHATRKTIRTKLVGGLKTRFSDILSSIPSTLFSVGWFNNHEPTAARQ
jgi:hypothetical protein